MLRAFFCWIIHYLICCANSFIPLFLYLIALSLFLKHPFNFSAQYQEDVGLREDFDVRDPRKPISILKISGPGRRRGSQGRFLSGRPEKAN